MTEEQGFWLMRHEYWHKVTKAEYVSEERAAGFYNTIGQPKEPATASFCNGLRRGTTFDPCSKELR